MPNPGQFHRAREAFLESVKEEYALAVKQNAVKEKRLDIIRRYYLRFPVAKGNSYEPTPEELAAVDDSAAPPEESRRPTSPEEQAEYDKQMEEHGAFVRVKNAIARRLKYVYDKEHKNATHKDPVFAKLMTLLTGTAADKPHKVPAKRIWLENSGKKVEIDQEHKAAIHSWGVDRAAVISGKEKAKPLELHNHIVTREWTKLSADERQEWEDKAVAIHQEAVRKWVGETVDFSEEPEDRQKCINALIAFMQPIIDAVSEATGWPVTVIAGGPEPADGGRLNVVNLHAGATAGSVGLTFGAAMRLPYKHTILPLFGEFLKLCFSPEECKTRALPVDGTMKSLAVLISESVSSNDNQLFLDSEVFGASSSTQQGAGVVSTPSPTNPARPNSTPAADEIATSASLLALPQVGDAAVPDTSPISPMAPPLATSTPPSTEITSSLTSPPSTATPVPLAESPSSTEITSSPTFPPSTATPVPMAESVNGGNMAIDPVPASETSETTAASHNARAEGTATGVKRKSADTESTENQGKRSRRSKARGTSDPDAKSQRRTNAGSFSAAGSTLTSATRVPSAEPALDSLATVTAIPALGTLSDKTRKEVGHQLRDKV